MNLNLKAGSVSIDRPSVATKIEELANTLKGIQEAQNDLWSILAPLLPVQEKTDKVDEMCSPHMAGESMMLSKLTEMQGLAEFLKVDLRKLIELVQV